MRNKETLTDHNLGERNCQKRCSGVETIYGDGFSDRGLSRHGYGMLNLIEKLFFLWLSQQLVMTSSMYFVVNIIEGEMIANVQIKTVSKFQLKTRIQNIFRYLVAHGFFGFVDLCRFFSRCIFNYKIAYSIFKICVFESNNRLKLENVESSIYCLKVSWFEIKL